MKHKKERLLKNLEYFSLKTSLPFQRYGYLNYSLSVIEINANGLGKLPLLDE
jgi:hypothetical protein